MRAGTHQQLRILRGHRDSVRCLTVKDGMLISGSWDQTIKIWDFTSDSKTTKEQPERVVSF
ncbi:MAG: hypothetical protein JSR93_02725 [Verrucomicrobia bacterium]|nr:hypothetical protein [Verrucomicrobiota bacterium]